MLPAAGQTGIFQVILGIFEAYKMKTIIDDRTRTIPDLKEILKFKGLWWNLSMRDILIRYKQTFIGVLWAVARPLITILIFGILRRFIENPPNAAESFVEVSAGVILWTLISSSITDISNSMLSNANILTKVYFPKLIIPLSSLTVCLIDFAVAFVILLVFKLLLTGMPGPELLLFPFFVVYALAFSFAVGLFFATLNIKYRDIKFVIPFLLQIGFYVCPVFLSLAFYMEKLPAGLHPLFFLNPLVGIVEGFKYCFLGQAMQLPPVYFMAGMLITLLLLVLSLRYFTKFEKSFADYI